MYRQEKLLVGGLIALLSFHLTVSFGVFLTSNTTLALLVFFGVGYIFLADVLSYVPLVILPMLGALAVFVAMLSQGPDRHWRYSVATGIVPIFAFLLLAELTTFVAMRGARSNIDEPTCLYSVQSFTSSVVDLLDNFEPFWGDTRRHIHHAHIALSGGRLMIWSYADMSFVEIEPSVFDIARVPSQCADLFATGPSSG